ncbi:MAG TPA: hypothetical protein DD635_07480 [Flavobacteriales bacterium]|nr:hypothetical protein [Flavobacteriales bacterium]|tara:strand:- start:921 stop:1271 length:351 start_codon:yes stop_codon:yes gene_type:complete
MPAPHIVSLVHALSLILLGSYGYYTSDNPSMTALIPVIFGVILIVCNRGVKNQNKAIAHIAVLLTLLIVISLFMPLRSSIGRGDTGAVVRVSVMLITGVIAMVSFIQSFRAARKAK